MAAYTVPDAKDLAILARVHGLGGVTIEPVSRGTVNSSFRLATAAGPHFLRIYEEQDEAGAARELALVRHLATHGARTPRALTPSDGALSISVAGKPTAVFPFIYGDMRCQASVTPALVRVLGAEIATLHTAAAGAPEHPSRFDVAELGRRVDQIDQSPLHDHAAVLRQRLASISSRRDPALPGGMIHGDLFRDNVLWEDEGVSAFLDFESAGAGSFTYDLAVALLAWSFTDRFVPELQAGLVQGYESRRALSTPERGALFDELLFGALRFTITRITDCELRGSRTKDYRRFESRFVDLERLGPADLASRLGW